LHGEEGAGTRPVFDYDLLAQPFRERRRDKARHLVGTAARRKTDDPAHWAGWIILCGECPRRDCRQSGAGELQKLSSSNGHGVIPGEHRDLAECIGANGRAPLASEQLRSDKEVLSPPMNQKESGRSKRQVPVCPLCPQERPSQIKM
jgi:hypothetical protein